MTARRYGDDPEPSERSPAGLLVPVRPGPTGWTARLCRTRLGVRTAVGFTTRERLAAAFGPRQAWIRLAEPALRALAEPLGVTALTVDPRFSTRSVVTGSRDTPGPDPRRRTAGVPRTTTVPTAHTPAHAHVNAHAPGRWIS